MKKQLITAIVACAVGLAAGWALVSHQLSREHAADLARREQAWSAEKADLQAALERASQKPAAAPVVAAAPAAPQVITVTNRLSPEEIIERLKKMRVSVDKPRSGRLVVHEFERLIESGPEALPAIKAFLARNEDLDYETGAQRGLRSGKVPVEFGVPPSLRLGLFEATKDIGGKEAEALLADVLKTTGRGIEVAYLAQALQELAPNKYRDAVLIAAHDLLARPLADGASSALDKFDRSYLYNLLGVYNDQTQMAQAQSQLVLTNGAIDRVALRYLERTMGEQSIALAAQLWQDPRIPADQKEPLGQVALAYVGLNTQANQFYQTAINDPSLPPDSRKNLIEDLNQTGFADPKNLTQADLALIETRISMIEQLAPNAIDQVNAKAFQEAYKDLNSMRAKLTAQSAPAK